MHSSVQSCRTSQLLSSGWKKSEDTRRMMRHASRLQISARQGGQTNSLAAEFCVVNGLLMRGSRIVYSISNPPDAAQDTHWAPGHHKMQG